VNFDQAYFILTRRWRQNPLLPSMVLDLTTGPIDITGSLATVVAFYGGRLEDATTEAELDEAVSYGIGLVVAGELDWETLEHEAERAFWDMGYSWPDILKV
jgi:hypothetical protein